MTRWNLRDRTRFAWRAAKVNRSGEYGIAWNVSTFVIEWVFYTPGVIVSIPVAPREDRFWPECRTITDDAD